MKRIRSGRGTILALTVALGFVLALVVAAFFQLSMLMGGGQETRNAVDSGALNIGKDVFSGIKTSAADDDEHQFDDVADSKGEFNLGNINRVWSKALFINENAAANNSGAAEGHAQAIYDAAARISGRLSKKLNSPESLYPLFNKMSQQNSVRMLGVASSVQAAAGGWSTAYINRGSESNIEVHREQFPSQAAFDAVNAVEKDGKFYLKGYSPISVSGRDFFLVPFKSGEIPHLISRGSFEEETLAKKNLFGWADPLPNAFATHGQSVDGGKSLQQAMSWVTANPNHQINGGIPHAFIRIKLPGNKVKFNLNNTFTNELSYDFLPQGILQSAPAGIGQLAVTANLGVSGANLMSVLYNEPGSHKEMTSFLLQRIKQMNPDFGYFDLFALLKSQRVVKGCEEYFIYPNEEGKIVISAKDNVGSKAPWLKTFTKPDGLTVNIAHDRTTNVPGLLTEDLIGQGLKMFGAASVDQEGVFDLTPATGFDGCLGELSVYQVTNISVTAELLKPVDL